MLLRIFCLTFNSALGGFDDSGVREFLRDKELISVRDHLFVRNEIPYLTLVVKYFPFRAEAEQTQSRLASSGPGSHPQRRDESWRELLQESDMGLFNLMRDWRSKRSKAEGAPPYVVLTNVQLAQIVKSKPQSLADLARIDGVGKAKVEKYGAEILSFTRVSDPGESTPAPQNQEGGQS
jgi:superfamily II DNA helicase RecQ